MRFHIVKREACPLWKRLVLYLGAVVIALLLGAVVLMAIGPYCLLLAHVYHGNGGQPDCLPGL